MGDQTKAEIRAELERARAQVVEYERMYAFARDGVAHVCRSLQIGRRINRDRLYWQMMTIGSELLFFDRGRAGETDLVAALARLNDPVPPEIRAARSICKAQKRASQHCTNVVDMHAWRLAKSAQSGS